MWLGERFVADGWPTGVGNMLRCFPWLKASGRQNLLLVHPAPFVRAIAGVGAIGSHATLGGDHHNCVSPSQAFPLVWL